VREPLTRKSAADARDEMIYLQHWHVFIVNLRLSHLNFSPHVVGAQLHQLSTVDAHTDVLKPIHGKII